MVPCNQEEYCVFDHPLYVEARMRRMDNLRAHFDIETLQGRRILEAGCGTGELGGFFEDIGCRVVSVDAREEFISLLRKRYPGRQVAVMDLDRWDPAPLGRFDAILCFGILYHLAEPEAFLVECTRLTDTILLESIVLDSPWPQCLRVTDHEPGGSFSGIGCRPSVAWIVDLMQRCGFSAQDISSDLANWGGDYPSVFDWEPRYDGQWRYGDTFLRKMWVCRRLSASRPSRASVEQPPAPFQSEILPLLLGVLGRTDLSGVRILNLGRAPGDPSGALSSAGASVKHLSFRDLACGVEARTGDAAGPGDLLNLPASWLQTAPAAFDAVVLRCTTELDYSLALVFHLLKCMAPLLLAELAPGHPEAENIFRTLNRAGYCLTQKRLQRHGGQVRALLVFQLRQHVGAGLRPLLVHVHIHKCAGTSVNRLLQMSFTDRHVDHYPSDPGPFLTRDELVKLVLDRPEMVSLSSHSIRVFPPIIGNRLGLYVAFLREPIQRFVSYLTYSKKQYHTFPESLKRYLPANCADLPLRELAAWILENQPLTVQRGAHVTHFLTEQTWLDAVGGILKLSDRWLDPDALLYPGFEPIKLALATALLEDFFFVGLVEEMETSVRLLRERLQPYGLRLLDTSLPVENVSRELATDVDWLNPSDSVGRAVLASLEQDVHLYARFRTRVYSGYPQPGPATSLGRA